MIRKGIKDLIKTIRFSGLTIRLGFIGLNFAGGFSKRYILEILLSFNSSSQ